MATHPHGFPYSLVLIGSILLGGVSLAFPVSAQTVQQTRAQNSAEAESLFRDGKKLMAERRFDEACAKFSASHSLEPGLGTLLNLADCQEQGGATASAWTGFLQAAALARRAAQSAVEEVARERAQALEPRLTRLKIVVPEGARVEGLEIQRGSVGLDEAAWGSAIPVDPGSYIIRARAPGKSATEMPVLLDGDGQTLEVVIQPLVDLPAPAVPELTQEPAWTPEPQLFPAPVAQERTEIHSTVGLVAGGVGIAGLAAGAVFGLLAKSAWDSADCSAGLCADETAQAKAEDARLFATLGTVSLVAGGALAAVGTTVYFFLSDSSAGPAERASIRCTPLIATDGGGLYAVGSF